jgi:ribosomal protein S18 acetylase RimI-like enzyme
VATEVRLRDGTRAIIWSLLPSDRQALREAYEDLSPSSRLHRFLTPVPHLTDAMLDHLVDEVDGVDHVARVLFVLEDGHDGVPAGVARMIRYSADPAAADVAVTVSDRFQRRGVASALLADLLREPLAGVDHIVTEVAGDNPASLAMLRRLGPTTATRSGPNRLRVTVALPPPAPPARPAEPGAPDETPPGSSPS